MYIPDIEMTKKHISLETTLAKLKALNDAYTRILPEIVNYSEEHRNYIILGLDQIFTDATEELQAVLDYKTPAAEEKENQKESVS